MEEKVISQTYYRMVLLTSLVYVFTKTGKSISNFYGIGLLIFFMSLLLLHWRGRLSYSHIGWILLIPLSLPIPFWLIDGASMFLGPVLGFWHLFVAFFPVCMKYDI